MVYDTMFSRTVASSAITAASVSVGHSLMSAAKSIQTVLSFKTSKCVATSSSSGQDRNSEQAFGLVKQSIADVPPSVIDHSHVNVQVSPILTSDRLASSAVIKTRVSVVKTIYMLYIFERKCLLYMEGINQEYFRFCYVVKVINL